MLSDTGPYGPNIRVVCRPHPGCGSDLCVEVRDTEQPQGWRELGRFNDMSNDYAFTDARRLALNTRKMLMEGENV